MSEPITEAGRALLREVDSGYFDWRGRILAIEQEAIRAERERIAAGVRECECVPGHRCDCKDLRSLLYRILTSAEYPKMEAEGLAATALGLRWSEKDDRYVSTPEDHDAPD